MNSMDLYLHPYSSSWCGAQPQENLLAQYKGLGTPKFTFWRNEVVFDIQYFLSKKQKERIRDTRLSEDLNHLTWF
jgi:hypothetical protein